MPSTISALAAALIAALFFTSSGWALARLILPRPLALGVAPILGWAIFSVIALPFFSFFPFTHFLVSAFALVFLMMSCALLALGGLPAVDVPSLPWWAFAISGVQALLPAIAIMPKYVHGGVLLGPPMYDHAKVAIIDQIIRQGMPPQNPFFGLAGARSSLAYYYLWHFSAAALGIVLHINGWTADIAMTWFTAFASAMLMMALAMYFTGKRLAIWLVPVLSIPASLRPVIGLFSSNNAKSLIIPDSDIGAWVNQASWVPQHLASGCCCVVSALLIARIAYSGSWLAAVIMSLTVAVGFESSTWVGGVAFSVAALAVTPLLMQNMTAQERYRFTTRAGVAALLAGAVIAPFCLQQAADMASKGVGVPVALGPYHALGADFGAGFRPLVDLLAFWPVVVPFNLPALFPVGAIGYAYALRQSGRRDPVVMVLGCFAVACLAVTWLARSSIDNNDLGWRAAIPSILILTAFAAVAWSRWLSSAASVGIAAALVLAVAGLPQEVTKLRQNLFGQQPADAAGLARSASFWNDVRKYAGPGQRVGNNPELLSDLTPWPDNISWALLSNRPSCYSGWSTAIAYTDLSSRNLKQVDDLFRRVFAGNAQLGDVHDLAFRYQCQVILEASTDGAWLHDPFANAPEYRLVDTRKGQWKIYERITYSDNSVH